MARAFLIAVALALAACGPGNVVGPVRDQFYVGPAKLDLREELGLQAKISGLAIHGDRVTVLERRRRFARIRLSSNATGWVAAADLLTIQQWAKLERLAAQSAQLPVQAVAQPFEALNVHTDPNRNAPSFYVAAEEEPVDIVGHTVTPRVDHDPEFPLGYNPETVPPGSPVDDWHQVRIRKLGADGAPPRAGWVLSRLLYVNNIPDAVTQQANGAAIMAALPVGTVVSETESHAHWLMATTVSRNQRYDFDALRLLVWNATRNRYDVQMYQKDLIGFYPIQVGPYEAVNPNFATFTVTVETGELQRERRHYVFPKNANRPKLASTEVIQLPKPEPPRRENYTAPVLKPAVPAGPTYWERTRKRWHTQWSMAGSEAANRRQD